MLGHRPVREVDVSGTAVVELDEGLRGVGAELVDLDREDVARFFRYPFGLLAARIGPRDVRHQVAVEGGLSRGDLEGRAHAGAGRDRLRERAVAGGGGGPAAWGGEAEPDVRRGR